MIRATTASRALPPVLAGALILVLAPATGGLAPWLRERLGEAFAPIVTSGIAAVGAVAVVLVLLRLRSDSHLPRAWRLLLVLAGPAIAVLQQLLSDRGTPAEAAVERAHLLFYGGFALLCHRSFFLAAVLRGRSPGLEVPLLAFAVTTPMALLDETVQWSLALRVGELYDVLFDLFAALCGVVSACGLYPPRFRCSGQRERRLLAALSAASVLFAAFFVEAAHLGYRVSDPELGSFRSFFPPEELARRDRQSLERWRESPPRRPFGLFELEDRYQTEAAWHVQARNGALERGERELAFRENAILERYYGAFLSIRRDGVFAYRLDDWLRADLAREFARRPFPGYESGAHNRRIWLRPSRPLLWTGAAGAALALGLCGLRARRGPVETAVPLDSRP